MKAILTKEASLIENVKRERAEPAVSGPIASDGAMSKAELHLTVALDAILEANKIMSEKLVTETKEGGTYEQYTRRVH